MPLGAKTVYNIDVKLQRVCQAFRIQGKFLSCEEIKVGNVNRTYRVNFLHDDGKIKSYIVQSLNTYVFKEPIKVMENIDRVTEHIHARDPKRKALHFHHTEDRKTYLFEADEFWRLFNYIPSSTYNAAENLEIVYNAGEAFGQFQRLLSDFDASKLHETIPNFHNTRMRYQTLLADVEMDACDKVATVTEELAWLFSVMDKACMITDMHNRGELPLRVTHNDTKINNVLFEKDGSHAIAVIDLDTVMPGLVGHDFGDAIRFAANYVAEDCPEYERAGVNMNVFRAFSAGFLKDTAATLTKAEIDTLAISCFALTAELAVRFLSDYINGSPYFKIDYPEHNLVRARCQITLAKDMLTRLDEMEEIIYEIVEKQER